jgi:hypothetical protein
MYFLIIRVPNEMEKEYAYKILKVSAIYARVKYSGCLWAHLDAVNLDLGAAGMTTTTSIHYTK